MLKEEKELRKYLRESVSDDYPNEWKDVRKEWERHITALVKAVREDTLLELRAHDWRYDLQIVSKKKPATIRRK